VSEADWRLTTWEGSRRAQHDAFRRLSFREKILALERMAEVIEALQAGREGERVPDPSGADA